MEFELPPVEEAPVQPGEGHVALPEKAEVRQVMDGQERPARASESMPF